MLNKASESQWRPLSDLGQAFAVGLIYFVTARASLWLVVQPAGIAAIWPPSGLLLAILVLTPRARWAPIIGAVLLAIVLANLSVGHPLLVALGFAFANCLESAVAALALTWGRRAPLTMASLNDVFTLTLVAVIGTNAVTALLGAAVAALGLGAPFWQAWLVWWIADGLGMLLVGSCLLAWAPGAAAAYGPLSPIRAAEFGAALLTLIVVTLVTFGTSPGSLFSPSPYLTFPVLLWVAVRFGPRGASVAVLLLAVMVILATLQGRGPFAAVTSNYALRALEVQAFLLVEALSTLVLAALTSERRLATAGLERARATLEARVAERTAALVAANERLQREVSERAQAEVALRESQERVRQALRAARSFAFEWDRETDRVVRSSDYSAILGLSSEEAADDSRQRFFERIHPDDRPILLALATVITPASPTYHVCYRLIRPDGGVVTIEETGQAVFDGAGHYSRLFGISTDVTARQQASVRAARLQVITAGLSAARTPEQVAAVVVEQGVGALDAAAGGVFLRTGDDPELHLIASAGYSPEQLRSYLRLPLAAPVPVAEVVRTGAPIWIESRDQLLARYPHIAGASVQNHAFVVLPLVTAGHGVGSITLSFRFARSFAEDERGYMLTLADLCAQAIERARLYVTEREAHAQAEAAVRLRDQFLSIASHELKTPLTVLLGNAQLLVRRAARGDVMGERDQRALMALAEQAQRLDRLISMLLDVSRIETGQLTFECAPFDLGALLRRLVGELQPTLVQHTVTLHVPAVPLVILGDELRMEQVLQNLIYNAVKYSPDGGDVLVEAAAVDGSLVVKVADQGIGIPAAELSQLFTRFFRASNTAGRQIRGMGIGLYVAREIVERHGGSISVASVEGHGSTFTVTLPAQPPA